MSQAYQNKVDITVKQKMMKMNKLKFTRSDYVVIKPKVLSLTPIHTVRVDTQTPASFGSTRRHDEYASKMLSCREEKKDRRSKL